MLTEQRDTAVWVTGEADSDQRESERHFNNGSVAPATADTQHPSTVTLATSVPACTGWWAVIQLHFRPVCVHYFLEALLSSFWFGLTIVVEGRLIKLTCNAVLKRQNYLTLGHQPRLYLFMSTKPRPLLETCFYLRKYCIYLFFLKLIHVKLIYKVSIVLFSALNVPNSSWFNKTNRRVYNKIRNVEMSNSV